MRVEVILFDWGGTLTGVDRQPAALRRGAIEAARILGHADAGDAALALTRDILSTEAKAAADPSHRETDLRSVLADWASRLSPPADAERLAKAGDALGEAWVGSLDPIPGTIDALRELRERGYQLGLVSNCSVPTEYCRREFARQGLARLMDVSVFSSEVGYRKPSWIIYEEAIRRASPQARPADLSRVLFVGDSPACDVLAPAEMGMRTALVKRPPGIWPAEDYARARPDFRIDHVRELVDLLETG